MSTKSKLNAVERIDEVKSLKLLLVNWVWVSHRQEKSRKVKGEDHELYSLQVLPPL